MKFSIVTISFNQKEFIEKTIKSVIFQDFNDYEFIVLDPGSTDGSREIIEKYRANIDKIIFENDNGPVDALNKGFNMAEGDIFYYLNSDDIILPGTLTRVSSYFDENPPVDVLLGNGYVIDENDTILKKVISDKFNLKQYAYDGIIFLQQAYFFKASAYKKTNGFNIQNRLSWDAELLIDLALTGAVFSKSDDFYGCFRMYENNFTAQSHSNNNSYYKIRLVEKERLFTKIMGRPSKKIDKVVRYILIFRKYLISPKKIFLKFFKTISK